MRADIRFWTAIAMIGICGFSVARGWSIVHFSLADEIDLEKRRGRHAWSCALGVASGALKTELRDKIDPSDLTAANSRREPLATLSIEPLSSVDWLSLSGMQLVTDQPMEQVWEALSCRC